MFIKCKNTTDQNACAKAHLGSKLPFLLVGGVVGAALALLFAPKPGAELRQDIADGATRAYDETVDAAKRTKEHAAELVSLAKEKGSAMADSIRDSAAAAKEEFLEEADEVLARVQSTAHQVAESVRSSQIF